MADLLRSLLASPFERAEWSALNGVNVLGSGSADTVRQLRHDAETAFFTKITRPDGSFKASDITNELHHALIFYRTNLCAIWPFQEGDPRNRAFYFPETAPLDWLWLVEQFYGFYDLITDVYPYKAVIDILNNVNADYLSQTLCRRFAVVSRLIAHKKVARDKDMAAQALEEVDLHIKECAGLILRVKWERWERPPYTVHLAEVKRHTSWLNLQKIKVQQFGLSGEFLDLGIKPEYFIESVEGLIKVGEGLDAYLTASTIEAQAIKLIPIDSAEKSTDKIQRKQRDSTVDNDQRLKEMVDNFMKIDGKNRTEAIRLTAQKVHCHTDTVERALGLRKR